MDRDFEEKPERPRSNMASLAVYVLTPAAQDLLDDYLRGGGNRDAPGRFLSWLTRATTVYGYVTDGHALRRGHPRVLRRSAARVPGGAGSLAPLTAETPASPVPAVSEPRGTLAALSRDGGPQRRLPPEPCQPHGQFRTDGRSAVDDSVNTFTSPPMCSASRAAQSCLFGCRNEPITMRGSVSAGRAPCKNPRLA